MGSLKQAKLWECKTTEQQAAWIKQALERGQTLSDSRLWLGGVDKPAAIIAKLMDEGMPIKVTTKKVVDAADQEHDDLAWTLSQ